MGAVMRRLFKTWHPDKAGNTPVAAKIFHMLRCHEEWYKKRAAGEDVGDDSWLDKEEFGETKKKDASAKGEDVQLALEDGDPGQEGAGKAKDDAEGAQASWFEEFEKEINKGKEEKTAKDA